MSDFKKQTPSQKYSENKDISQKAEVPQGDRAPTDFSENSKRSAERKREEGSERARDEKRADRMIESPDLKEVTEKLKEQVLAVKKIMDGTLHEERVKDEKNSVVKISELEGEVNKINGEIQKLRNEGKKFRAVDLWGAVLNMPITPNEIALRFPGGPEENWKQYVDNFRNGALYSAQSMHLRIDANGFTIVDEETQKNPRQQPAELDTFLFMLQASGKIDRTSKFSVSLNGKEKEYWNKTLVQRAKDYGFEVRSLDDPRARSYQLYVDLKPANWKTEGRYLYIEAQEAISVWNRGVKMYLTDKPPPSSFKLE